MNWYFSRRSLLALYMMPCSKKRVYRILHEIPFSKELEFVCIYKRTHKMRQKVCFKYTRLHFISWLHMYAWHCCFYDFLSGFYVVLDILVIACYMIWRFWFCFCSKKSSEFDCYYIALTNDIRNEFKWNNSCLQQRNN